MHSFKHTFGVFSLKSNMATERMSDEGSNEKLLEDSEKQTPGDMDDEEEDCIKLLLKALEKGEAEADEDSEGEGKRFVKYRKADSGYRLHVRDATDRGYDSLNASASELNMSRIKLDIPVKGQPSNEANFSKMSPPVQDKQRRRMKLYKKHNSETGKILCGFVVMVILLGVGGSMICLAWMLDMEDLYILGGIFSFGFVIFTLAFIVVRCQAHTQLEDTDYSVLFKA